MDFMAGDWIKIQHALPDKPEVVQMSQILGLDQDAVTGKLIRLWVWTDQQSESGNALSVTESFIDRITFVAGFAQSLRSVGWLHGADGDLSLPNFTRHNGKTAKTRANTQKRVQALRSRNADSVNKSVTREEKRREEKNPSIYIPGEGIRIPSSVDTPEIQTAVGRWFAHINADDTHKSIPPNSPQEEATWRLVASWGTPGPETVAAIDAAIAGQWSNLRKPEAPRAERGNGKSKSPSIMETLDDMIEEEKRNEQF